MKIDTNCLQKIFKYTRLIYYPSEILNFIFNSLKIETDKWISHYVFLDKFRITKEKKNKKNPSFPYLLVFEKDDIEINFMLNNKDYRISFIAVFIIVNKKLVSKKFFTFFDFNSIAFAKSESHELFVSQEDLQRFLKTQNTLLENFNNIKI